MNSGTFAPTERLAFNAGHATVPGRWAIDAGRVAAAEPTFATATYAEPRDWGYLGLLAFTAVLLLRPQDQLPALTSFHLAEICAFVGIGPMLLHRFARRAPVFRVTPETMGLVAFGVVMLATAPFSIWPGGAFGLFFDSYLKIVIVFVLMMNTLTTPRRLEQVIWLIVCCCGYIAARAVVDYARGVNLVEGGRVAGAVSGIFGNPNDLALNMVTFMPAALMVAVTRRFSTVRRLTAAGIAALMFATVVFTKSRGGALGMVAMIAAFLLLNRRTRPGLTVIVLAAVVVATPLIPATFWSRMATITDSEADKAHYTGSSDARWTLMQEGIDTFMAYPLTGVGAGQFKNFNPPQRKERWRETHNALIQVAAETGILGLAAFLFLIARAALAASRARRLLSSPFRTGGGNDPLSQVLSEPDRRSLFADTAALIAGLAGWFVCAAFASVAYSWTFYYLLALIVATRELVRVRLDAALARTTVAVPGLSFHPAISPKAVTHAS